MDFTAIREIADLGGTVILTVMLWLIWTRLNVLTDRLIDILAKMADESVGGPADENN